MEQALGAGGELLRRPHATQLQRTRGQCTSWEGLPWTAPPPCPTLRPGPHQEVHEAAVSVLHATLEVAGVRRAARQRVAAAQKRSQQHAARDQLRIAGRSPVKGDWGREQLRNGHLGLRGGRRRWVGRAALLGAAGREGGGRAASAAGMPAVRADGLLHRTVFPWQAWRPWRTVSDVRLGRIHRWWPVVIQVTAHTM